jgi:hypothetical protein
MLDNDLRAAALAALQLDRETVRRYAVDYSWQRATAEFLAHLRPDHARLRPA